nr:max dimerization protein 3 isoform X2 [Danio rerio]|eukprot:XP_021336670.1 max dimerization protein 3 isoform X2 [Danio rerio]
MEVNTCNIQVLLQAAEYLERRERGLFTTSWRNTDSSRNTTLNLLRQAQLHIKKLQEQDERAKLLKDRLRWEQRELRTRLEKLQGGSERMRNDSLGSAVSSERSDSEREDVEIDVESMVWTLEADALGSSHAGVDHSYSTSDHAWL